MCSWEEEHVPVAPSWEPAYGTEIRQNFTASVSAPSLGGGGEKRLKVSARFRGQSISCFATETLVVRLCMYLGSVARLISSHMAVHTWLWGGEFLFSFELCLLESMLHFLPFRGKKCGL